MLKTHPSQYENIVPKLRGFLDLPDELLEHILRDVHDDLKVGVKARAARGLRVSLDQAMITKRVYALALPFWWSAINATVSSDNQSIFLARLSASSTKHSHITQLRLHLPTTSPVLALTALLPLAQLESLHIEIGASAAYTDSTKLASLHISDFDSITWPATDVKLSLTVLRLSGSCKIYQGDTLEHLRSFLATFPAVRKLVIEHCPFSAAMETATTPDFVRPLDTATLAMRIPHLAAFVVFLETTSVLEFRYAGKLDEYIVRWRRHSRSDPLQQCRDVDGASRHISGLGVAPGKSRGLLDLPDELLEQVLWQLFHTILKTQDASMAYGLRAPLANTLINKRLHALAKPIWFTAFNAFADDKPLMLARLCARTDLHKSLKDICLRMSVDYGPVLHIAALFPFVNLVRLRLDLLYWHDTDEGTREDVVCVLDLLLGKLPHLADLTIDNADELPESDFALTPSSPLRQLRAGFGEWLRSVVTPAAESESLRCLPQ
ncbi:hypothetical protein Rhopal_004628-T1 [Rhodotorula paludigena]|uniref:F-box domain-containing protein n=1 Tax=Rhodotorula paludigena TaxID=86838 RepID=A0AAV5GQ15_9BASI|nr:hypothetical protein Rhopal_004628-T1 [Rhodotorula paludigena]